MNACIKKSKKQVRLEAALTDCSRGSSVLRSPCGRSPHKPTISSIHHQHAPMEWFCLRGMSGYGGDAWSERGSQRNNACCRDVMACQVRRKLHDWCASARLLIRQLRPHVEEGLCELIGCTAKEIDFSETVGQHAWPTSTARRMDGNPWSGAGTWHALLAIANSHGVISDEAGATSFVPRGFLSLDF